MPTKKLKRKSGPPKLSPFMRLPAELRVKIYSYAIQDRINEIEAYMDDLFIHKKPLPTMVPCQFSRFSGPLALLHVSHQIHAESSDTMYRIVKERAEYLSARYENLSQELRYGCNGNGRHAPALGFEAAFSKLASLEYHAQETMMIDRLLSKIVKGPSGDELVFGLAGDKVRPGGGLKKLIRRRKGKVVLWYRKVRVRLRDCWDGSHS